jgi:hypothetical protein
MKLQEPRHHTQYKQFATDTQQGIGHIEPKINQGFFHRV